MLVKITNLRGETGLRQPGTLYLVPDELGKVWIEKGWAVKEEKAAIETKEEKFKVKTKETKRKRVTKTKVH